MMRLATLNGNLIALALLTSCVTQQPSDLYVDRIQRTRIEEPSANIGDGSPNTSPILLKIDVATPSGLTYVADSFGSPLRFTVRFCGVKNFGPRSAIRYPNPLTGESGNLGETRDSHGVYHYNIYIYVSDHPAAYESRLPYDLSLDPHDVCISAFGGNETGFSYRSNEAVASHAQIMAALK